jgi:ABC-2 type transport system permease protein
MKTMKWLLHREFWEHKGAFFWAPVIVALAMIVLLGGGMVYGLVGDHFSNVTVINGHEVSRMDVIDAMPASMRAKIAGIAASSYLAAAAPLFVVLPLVVFFYCLATLYDDRRDRSILFWKSLPVSDQMTVLSKVVTALVVAPLITIAIGTATALLLLFVAAVGATYKGLSLFGPLLTSADLYLAPLHLVALLPVYMLWALPTVGWLLLVSSWARSKVFLWAVGVPMITLVILTWFNFLVSRYSDSVIDVNWFTGNVIVRGLGGLVPGVWMLFDGVPKTVLLANSGHGIDVGNVVAHSWMTLAQPGVWIAAAAGVAMLFAAVRLRRWRDEG